MRSSIILLSALAFSATQALPFFTKRGTGAAIVVNSETDFCSYLPPGPGEEVSVTENDASPFCTNPTSFAAQFPTGFIITAHYASTDGYTQVTGRIDHTAYSISTADGGGQYDNKDLPNGTCNGWNYFVNVIDPDADLFCIRCCQDRSDCNLGISTEGCEKIVPGDYS